MNSVVVLVLGGGRGTRLDPLTRERAKPAVPLAGKYRLIDVPISNCLNSRLNRIFVLTQFNSVSLNRHIHDSYHLDPFGGGCVEILAAQQTHQWGDVWYQGTADAVRKQLRYIEGPGVEQVLILSGDQLYRMDFQVLIDAHRNAGAEVTIATLPIDARETTGVGVLRCDDTGRVTGLVEKPQTPEALAPFRTDPDWIDGRGLASRGRDCLASMGIYLFDRDVLVALLRETHHEDFAKEVFPEAIRRHRVFAFLFDGYWEDIGTIGTYYRANLRLAGAGAPFQFDVPGAPIYTRPRYLPPSRIEGAAIRRSLVVDGCWIDEGAVIENSVVGVRSQIGRGVTIRNSVLFGNGGDDAADEARANDDSSLPPIGIGDGSVIEGAIVDRACRIGRNIRIGPRDGLEANADLGPVVIRDGVIVVPQGTILPDGYRV